MTYSVNGASVNNLSIEGNIDAESAIRFINSKDLLLSGVRLTSPAKILLQTEGAGNKNIRIYSSDLSRVEKVVSFMRGADSSMVKVQ